MQVQNSIQQRTEHNLRPCSSERFTVREGRDKANKNFLSTTCPAGGLKTALKLFQEKIKSSEMVELSTWPYNSYLINNMKFKIPVQG